MARIGNKLEQAISRPLTTHSLSLVRMRFSYRGVFAAFSSDNYSRWSFLLQDQQVFFRKCVETVIGSSPEKRRVRDREQSILSFCVFVYGSEHATKYLPHQRVLLQEVLHLLASDPGLQSLVPRFAVLIFEGEHRERDVLVQRTSFLFRCAL